MDKYVGLMFMILFAQFVTFAWIWGLSREVRLLSSVVERVRVWTTKR